MLSLSSIATTNHADALLVAAAHFLKLSLGSQQTTRIEGRGFRFLNFFTPHVIMPGWIFARVIARATTEK